MRPTPTPRTDAPPGTTPDTAADDAVGLTSTVAARRLAEDGPNALPGGQRRTLLAIARDTAKEPMFLLLLAPEFYQPLRDLAAAWHDRAAALAVAVASGRPAPSSR